MITGFLRPVLIGVLLGILGCMGVLVILAVCASTVDIPLPLVVPLSTVAAAFGTFIGSFAAAKFSGRNGWLIGLLTALLLVGLLTIVGVGFRSPIDGGFLLTRTLIMLACGPVGGMLAVNIGRRNKR